MGVIQETKKDRPVATNPKGIPYAVLTEPKTGTKIILEDGAHLGRAEFPKQLSPRALPDIFKKARVAIQIIDSLHISRNHALILLEGDSWVLYDLNSKNGTFVNYIRLESGKPRPLNDGDMISLSDAKLHFNEQVREAEHGALLISNGAFNSLGQGEGHIAALAEGLTKRGWKQGNVTILRDATVDAVISALEIYEAMMTKDSTFFFCFSGQGSDLGLFMDGKTLSANEFYVHLRNMRGRKIVAIDAEHSEQFLRDAPQLTLVLLGEKPQDLKRFEGQELGAIPHNFVQGFLVKALAKLLMQETGILDLKRMGSELEQCHTIVYNPVEVHAQGSTIMLRSVAEKAQVAKALEPAKKAAEEKPVHTECEGKPAEDGSKPLEGKNKAKESDEKIS